MSRYRASLIHLLISAVLVGSVAVVVLWLWYPEPVFEVVDAFPMIRLFVGVNLVLGPLLTLAVYKHGKRGLQFDLYVIALTQIAVLVFGAYTLHDEKPHYLVFAIDRLEFISKKHVDQSAVRFDELRTKRFANLVEVFARLPEDPDEYQRYVDSVMFEGKPDLERRAEYWEPWSSGADVIRRQIKLIGDIKPESSGERENLRQAIDNHQETHPNLGMLPIGGVEKDIGMLLDVDTLEILDVLNVNPWN